MNTLRNSKSKKKFIHCDACGGKTWHEPESHNSLSCRSCGFISSFYKLKANEAKLRKAKRASRADTLALAPKIKKPKREIDDDYRKWIRTLPCTICKRYGVHPHHVDRTSQFGSDKTCVPLCPEHHTEIHAIGVDSFDNKHDIDLTEIVKLLNKRYTLEQKK